MTRNSIEVLPYVRDRTTFADKTAEIGTAWASRESKRKVLRKNPAPSESSIPFYDPNEQLTTQLELRLLRLDAQRRNGLLKQRRYEFLVDGTKNQLERLKGGV